MDVKITKCTPQCTNVGTAGAIYQNEKYKDQRVFNPCPGETKEKTKYRCTICGGMLSP
jgi:hypothetical protein